MSRVHYWCGMLLDDRAGESDKENQSFSASQPKRKGEVDYVGWLIWTSRTSSGGIGKYSGSWSPACSTSGRISNRPLLPTQPSF